MDSTSGTASANTNAPAPSSASYSSLAPTQAIASSNRRRRGPRKPPRSGEGEGAGDVARDQSQPTLAQGSTESKATEGKENKGKAGKPKRRRNRKAQVAAQPQTEAENDDARANNGDSNDHSDGNKAKQQTNAKGKSKPNRRKRNNNNKRFPWRQHIPEGTVDPITLDPLESLPYPPFALVASPPYDPVPVWPVPEDGKEQQDQQKLIDPEELNRRRIAEQWGGKLSKEDKPNPEKQEVEPTEAQPRHFHLYDGRALAFYLVSQLQFIDPLNRRDLTRAELQNLDAYLARHGGKADKKLKVVEAYDAKGITLSSAGAAAHTAQGRADIMQQMASNLLNSLFGRTQNAPEPRPARQERPNRRRDQGNTNSNQENSLQAQYAEIERMERERAQRMEEELARANGPAASSSSGPGVYGSFSGGLMVIDDDENPGLRGDARPFVPGASAVDEFPPIGNPSARFVASRYPQAGAPPASGESFPALSSTASTPSTSRSPPRQRTLPSGTSSITRSTTLRNKAAKPSKTLSRIAGAVKKTSEAEKQRQWEAREVARKKALLTNLSFGVDPRLRLQEPQLLTIPMASMSTDPISEEQLERNRALADALGVAPASARNNSGSGPAENIGREEFSTELLMYPDSLITKVRDNSYMPLVLKLEKKWSALLSDPMSPSVSLHPMNRACRSLVHEYAEWYGLRTESFDPEPKRYVHCVKTRDASVPRMLLSDAVRKWKGPTIRPILPAEGRVVDGIVLPTGPRGVDTPPSLDPIAVRPKLQLDPPRVKDAEEKDVDAPEEEPASGPVEDALLLRRQARERAAAERRQRAEEAKERALRAAFRDDDDSSNSNGSSISDDNSDSSSVWEDPLVETGGEEIAVMD